MEAIVYASAGGRKYHFDRRCQLLELGQYLNDWGCEGPCYGHSHATMHAVRQMSTTKAAIFERKLPCLDCVPKHLRRLPEAETFGHERQWIDGDWFCATCHSRGYDEDGERWRYPLLWPCTSAIILGLVPRTAVAA